MCRADCGCWLAQWRLQSANIGDSGFVVLGQTRQKRDFHVKFHTAAAGAQLWLPLPAGAWGQHGPPRQRHAALPARARPTHLCTRAWGASRGCRWTGLIISPWAAPTTLCLLLHWVTCMHSHAALPAHTQCYSWLLSTPPPHPAPAAPCTPVKWPARVQVSPGDVVVAGSDGLWDNLSQESIARRVKSCLGQVGAQAGLLCQAGHRQSCRTGRACARPSGITPTPRSMHALHAHPWQSSARDDLKQILALDRLARHARQSAAQPDSLQVPSARTPLLASTPGCAGGATAHDRPGPCQGCLRGQHGQRRCAARVCCMASLHSWVQAWPLFAPGSAVQHAYPGPQLAQTPCSAVQGPLPTLRAPARPLT